MRRAREVVRKGRLGCLNGLRAKGHLKEKSPTSRKWSPAIANNTQMPSSTPRSSKVILDSPRTGLHAVRWQASGRRPTRARWSTLLPDSLHKEFVMFLRSTSQGAVGVVLSLTCLAVSAAAAEGLVAQGARSNDWRAVLPSRKARPAMPRETSTSPTFPTGASTSGRWTESSARSGRTAAGQMVCSSTGRETCWPAKAATGG